MLYEKPQTSTFTTTIFFMSRS